MKNKYGGIDMHCCTVTRVTKENNPIDNFLRVTFINCEISDLL